MCDSDDRYERRVSGGPGHICEESRVGALLSQEKFPISDQLREAAKILKKEPYGFFLGDSDDYQLIITCRPRDVEPVRSAIALTYKGL